MYYNQGYQMDVIDPYYPPEIIEVMQPPPPVEVIMPSPMYSQPVVVVEQPQYGPTATGPSQGDMECCLMLGACCVMEECGMCVIS